MFKKFKVMFNWLGENYITKSTKDFFLSIFLFVLFTCLFCIPTSNLGLYMDSLLVVSPMVRIGISMLFCALQTVIGLYVVMYLTYKILHWYNGFKLCKTNK